MRSFWLIFGRNLLARTFLDGCETIPPTKICNLPSPWKAESGIGLQKHLSNCYFSRDISNIGDIFQVFTTLDASNFYILISFVYIHIPKSFLICSKLLH